MKMSGVADRAPAPVSRLRYKRFAVSDFPPLGRLTARPESRGTMQSFIIRYGGRGVKHEGGRPEGGLSDKVLLGPPRAWGTRRG